MNPKEVNVTSNNKTKSKSDEPSSANIFGRSQWSSALWRTVAKPGCRFYSCEYDTIVTMPPGLYNHFTNTCTWQTKEGLKIVTGSLQIVDCR